MSRGRIMFVDDEQRILRSLQRVLRRRTSWELRFAGSAEEATELLRGEAVDVLVSDVSMPGVSGIELLAHARDIRPDAMRILMSGTTEGRTMMRAVPIAHRFLDKPVSIPDLTRIIEDALTIRNLLSDPAIRAVAGRVSALPSVPRVFEELTRVLEDPRFGLDSVVCVVERDPAISARVLHIVGSAFFAAPRRIASIADAVCYLGTSLLRNLVLVAGVLRLVEEGDLPAGLSLTAERDHAVQVAFAAQAIADPEHAAVAYTAGLLHDAGMLLFAAELPELWAPMLARARDQDVPLHDVERDELGVTHAELGAYLFGIWGLPGELVDAVASHHVARAGDGIDAALAVHIADRLIGDTRAGDEIDDSELEALGALERVRAWRARAV